MIDFLRSRIEFISASLLIFAWLVIFGLRSIPVGGEWGALDNATTTFILLWVSLTSAAIIVGGWLAQRMAPGTRIISADPNGAVILLSLAALVGAVLIIVEFAFVRGYGFNTPVRMIRLLEVTRGFAGAPGSLLSGPGRLLLPAILPALLLVALYWGRISRLALMVFGIAAVAFLFEQVKFEGGRWFLFSTYFTLIVGFLADFLKKDREKKNIRIKLIKTLLFLGFYGAVLFTYSGWVFADRYANGNATADLHYERFSDNFSEVETVDSSESIRSTGGFIKNTIDPQTNEEIKNTKTPNIFNNAIAKFFWIYATHGVNELNELVLGDSFSLGLGALQFPQIARVSDRLLGTDLRVEYRADFPNEGHYTTLIGGCFVDFGFVGAVCFGIAFGLLLGYWANLFGRTYGVSFSSLAYPAIMTVALISPIVSIVSHIWPVICWAAIARLVFVTPNITGFQKNLGSEEYQTTNRSKSSTSSAGDREPPLA
ncbi:MAG: hypothetical protein RIA09_19815 [Hoeflea sp.]|uniref:hypothetical protein n=1 Tax=Hoeflea sp. TaxID=1940281 RepID=UPI0032EAEDE7